jgi:hypothetical protein
MMTKSIERAQKKVEENNFGVRKRLLEYDDVMNAQREVVTNVVVTPCLANKALILQTCFMTPASN